MRVSLYFLILIVSLFIIETLPQISISKRKTMLRLRLPNAYPAMFAGIKFAGILANSIAVLTAFIGSGGLGEIIFQGLIGYNTKTLLSGAIPAIMLAIMIDLSFTVLEKKVTPGYAKE